MTELSWAEAEQKLKPFACNQGDDERSDAEWQAVRDALLVLVEHSDFQTLGICADSPQAGIDALIAYLKAFGDSLADLDPTPPEVGSETVYLKFNTQRRSLHWDQYLGPYRGVLVTCQSHDPTQSGGTYGHFPLHLFAE